MRQPEMPFTHAPKPQDCGCALYARMAKTVLLFELSGTFRSHLATLQSVSRPLADHRSTPGDFPRQIAAAAKLASNNAPMQCRHHSAGPTCQTGQRKTDNPSMC